MGNAMYSACDARQFRKDPPNFNLLPLAVFKVKIPCTFHPNYHLDSLLILIVQEVLNS